MSNTESHNSARLSKWTGKKAEWAMWEEQFLARAKRKGYKNIALGRVIVPRVSDVIQLPETVEAREAREKIIDLNDQGYSDLITMIDTTKSGGKVAFSIIKRSKTSEYPDGNIAVAMDGLKRKYLSLIQIYS